MDIIAVEKYLESLTDEIATIPARGVTKLAKCTNVLDFDTCNFAFLANDNNLTTVVKLPFRLSGSKSMLRYKKSAKDHESDEVAKEKLEECLLGEVVMIKFDGTDRCGRSLVKVWVDFNYIQDLPDSLSVNTMMTKEKYWKYAGKDEKDS